MRVINYYALSDKELKNKIDEIKNWLFDHPKDERYRTAAFALDVALCAKELRAKLIDSFTQAVLENLI